MLLARVAQTVFLTAAWVNCFCLNTNGGLIADFILISVCQQDFSPNCDRLGDEILDYCARNVSITSGLFNSRAAVHVRELNWMDPWPLKSVSNNIASLKKYSWTSAEFEEVQGASLIVAADVLYLTLEKRYNFSLVDLDVVANGYSRFGGYLRLEGEHERFQYGGSPCFVGKCIGLTQIPQYVKEYERGQDVELWEIRYNRKKQ
ncbi:uncharacterized protein LOC110816219 isoform X2 [Carica papaya]|nr:uncharacterized protein LOC110816219 isoform X2 [Carica papaya]XP_021900014.1 uncharacterized protein LOC110816219 isoform X2 [Carica papaya]XP_021900015.1 uncharacterized protein LOC110816219 isoform X2 [Carica papaya]